jgi:hypothetical protein
MSHWHPDAIKIVFDKYANRKPPRICVKLQALNGEPYGILSVNVPDVDNIELDEFVVKNYSENTGLDDLSRYGGRFEDTGKRVKVGFATCPVWRVINQN